MLDGELVMCFKVKGVLNVLDMGIGIGSWVMDYGKCYILIWYFKLVLIL